MIQTREESKEMEGLLDTMNPLQQHCLVEVFRNRRQCHQDRWAVPRDSFGVATLRALYRRGMFDVYKENPRRVIFTFTPKGEKVARLLTAVHYPPC
jgi:hypothetical protein